MSSEPTHQGRQHTCPECNQLIEADTERSFEEAWEAHRATHKPEDQVDLSPTPEQLIEAHEKAKREAIAVERLLKSEEEHVRDLERHFEGLSRIEHKLPQLIDFGFKLANAVGNFCQEKDYRTKALKLGTIYWTPSGDIAAEFTYDKFDISAPEDPEYLKRGYARLPKLNAQYPAVFELVMTLGEHLTNICENRRLTKKDISFTNLHHFVSPTTKTDFWAFRILNRRAVLRASNVHF